MIRNDRLAPWMFEGTISRNDTDYMFHIIDRWFEINRGFSIRQSLHVVNDTHYTGYAMVNCQDKSIEMEEGVTLTHFSLTPSKQVVAVCFDEDEVYVYYDIGL